MKNQLLSYRWKWVGYFFTLLGILAAVLYFAVDLRFKIPVFAIYSAFVETKIFATFRTNFADELILLLLIAGLSIIALSAERYESELLDALRSKSFVRALKANTVLLLCSTLFVFGSGFLYIMIFSLISFYLFYLFFFYLAKWNQSGT